MKHLKKDDGYVLVYVLIVFTVLALVAGSICTMALNNLKAQKADVARMEARYEAEGYLQQFIAGVEALSVSTPQMNFPEENQAQDAAEALYWANVEDFAEELEPIEGLDLVTVSADQNTDTVTVEIFDSGKTVAIEVQASVALVCDGTEYSTSDGEGQPLVSNWAGTCSTKADGWTYNSYTISYQSADSAEGEVPDET